MHSAKKNGASSIDEFRELVNSHREPKEKNPQIGCIILNQPFFFSENEWIDPPEDWSYNMPGKVYDSESIEGEKIWNEVRLRLQDSNFFTGRDIISEPVLQYGKEYIIRGRLGQGAFRIFVTSAYNRRCGISGEKTLPVLEAAHIKSYKENGPNQVNNGILLRSDIHKLFDSGYITITSDYKIEVSRKIKEEFDNGKNYYVFHGKQLAVLPKEKRDYPSIDFIKWHNETFLV